MKVTLDLDKLLATQDISQAEYDRLAGLGERAMGSLAFNILVGFGVIAVSGSTLALLPGALTALLLGVGIFAAGIWQLRSGRQQWQVLGNICVLVGALMAGGGLLDLWALSTWVLVLTAAVYALAAVYARSSLLAVLAVLALGAAVGDSIARDWWEFGLEINSSLPLITILVFGVLAAVLLRVSMLVSAAYARLALAAAATCVLLVNAGFWLGSVNGPARGIDLGEGGYAIVWALALVAAGVWAWRTRRRWLLNCVAAFAGIHFYTQWFERLDATPGSVLIAELIALSIAVALHLANGRLQELVASGE